MQYMLFCFSWVPVYADPEKKLSVMSIGFLLTNQNDAVVWRGPKKTGMLERVFIMLRV